MKVGGGIISDVVQATLTLALSLAKERRPSAHATLQLPAIAKRPLGSRSLARTLALDN